MNTITPSIEYIEKFKQLYFRKYNAKLSGEESTRMATDLLNLMRILVKPSHK